MTCRAWSRQALGGAAATQVHEGERTFDLVVEDDPGIGRGPRFDPAHSSLRLEQRAPDTRRADLGRCQIGFLAHRTRGESRRAAVKLSVRGRDLGSLVAEGAEKSGRADQAAHGLPTGMDRLV